ncbi:hypothetical protein [Marinitoga lauensis]|uniref:hypothetical protein n=1 Tax=Marinitoga lauensis TaxID=2201189 RepID=UPI001013132D|nr:hypothetical protein [Marinitoga lauensis]
MKKYKLKEISNIFLSPSLTEMEDGDILYIKPKNIKENKISYNELSRAIYDKNRNIEKYFLKKGDIIFRAKGTNFYATLIDKDVERLISSQIFFNIRITILDLYPEFLLLQLNNKYNKQYFEENSHGKIVKIIKKEY